MPITEEVIQGVILYLTHNKKALINRIQPLIEQKKELLKTQDSSFKEDIEKEFLILSRREIADEIATGLNLNPEDVYMVVETMDVNEFISSLMGGKG